MSDPRTISVSATGLTDEQRDDIVAHVRGLVDESPTYPRPEHGWTCFHCGETFMTPFGARLHFGRSASDAPLCQTTTDKRRQLRKSIRELRNAVFGLVKDVIVLIYIVLGVIWVWEKLH